MQTFIIVLSVFMALHVILNLAFLCSNKGEYVITCTRKTAVIKIILGCIYLYFYHQLFLAIQ